MAVKKHVLRGAAYRSGDLEEAAYELRRFFAQSKERVGSLAAERDKLEATISRIEATHRDEVLGLQEQITAMRDREKEKEGKRTEGTARRNLLIKEALALVLLLALFYAVSKAAGEWGVGINFLQKVKDFFPYYLIGFLGWAIFVKLVLFRSVRLTELLAWWQDIKELLPH